jgi:Holliday junction resolvasome RuvABC endonuclease subunit
MAGVDHDMLVVGIDASPRRIGWAITHNHNVIAADTWHVDKTADIASRRAGWSHIRDQIRTAERTTNRELHAVGIEDSYIGPNRKGSLDLARTIGHIEAWAYVAFPYVRMQRIAAGAWRSALGLPLRGKPPALAYARDVLDPTGLWDRLDDQDTADAICIACAVPIIIHDN